VRGVILTGASDKAFIADGDLLATATETGQKLAAKLSGALLASKRLIKQASIGEVKAAIKIENEGFFERVRKRWQRSSRNVMQAQRR